MITLPNATVGTIFVPAYIPHDVILFDMDGVVAKWGTENTHEPGFFRNRPVVDKARRLIMELKKDNYVMMMSSVYTDGTSVEDKIGWLNEFLPGVPFIFVPYGENKSDYIQGPGMKVLVDDYSTNLHDWKEKGGVGIKYMNGLNGTNGTWKHDRLEEDMTVDEMVKKIKETIRREKKRHENLNDN